MIEKKIYHVDVDVKLYREAAEEGTMFCHSSNVEGIFTNTILSS